MEYAKIVTSFNEHRIYIGLFFESLSRSNRQGLNKPLTN